jgi:hypothetical protein
VDENISPERGETLHAAVGSEQCRKSVLKIRFPGALGTCNLPDISPGSLPFPLRAGQIQGKLFSEDDRGDIKDNGVYIEETANNKLCALDALATNPARPGPVILREMVDSVFSQECGHVTSN